MKILMEVEVDARNIADARNRLVHFMVYSKPENFGLSITESQIDLDMVKDLLTRTISQMGFDNVGFHPDTDKFIKGLISKYQKQLDTVNKITGESS